MRAKTRAAYSHCAAAHESRDHPPRFLGAGWVSARHLTASPGLREAAHEHDHDIATTNWCCTHGAHSRRRRAAVWARGGVCTSTVSRMSGRRMATTRTSPVRPRTSRSPRRPTSKLATGGIATPLPGAARCFAGQPVTFSADFRMALTADTRYDVGFYIATDNDPNDDGAITGPARLPRPPTRTQSELHQSRHGTGRVRRHRRSFGPAITHCSSGRIQSPRCPSTQANSCSCPSLRLGGSRGRTKCAWVPARDATNDVFPGSPSKCNCGDPGPRLLLGVESHGHQDRATPPVSPSTGGSATYTVDSRRTRRR